MITLTQFLEMKVKNDAIFLENDEDFEDKYEALLDLCDT